MSNSNEILPQLKHLLFTGENIAAKSKDGRFIPGILDPTISEERNLCKRGVNVQARNLNIYKVAALTLKQATECIPELAARDKGTEIVDSLRIALKHPHTHKDVVVLYLAAVTKLPPDQYKKVVTEAYSAVPVICTNSTLLFLFIQFLKMMSTVGKAAWGRGLRRAVKNWYLRWDPKELALEMTRNFSAYGWSHRDVLKLSHVKLKAFPFGTQVVLSTIFSDIAKTEALYGHMEVAKELLDFMKVLKKVNLAHGLEDDGATPAVLAVRHIKKLSPLVTNLSINDVPANALQSYEVWNLLVDKLDNKSLIQAIDQTPIIKLLAKDNEEAKSLAAKYAQALDNDTLVKEITPTEAVLAINAIHRKARATDEKSNWKGKDVPVTKIRRGTTKKIPKLFNPIIHHLVTLVSTSAELLPLTVHRAALFVSTQDQMHSFVYSNTMAKELRGFQVASLISVYLSSGTNTYNTSIYCYDGSNRFAILDLDSGVEFPYIAHELPLMGTSLELNLSACINFARNENFNTAVMVTPEITAANIQEVKELCTKDASDPDGLRVVLCGLKSSICTETNNNSNILILQGVNHHTPEAVRQFHERAF